MEVCLGGGHGCAGGGAWWVAACTLCVVRGERCRLRAAPSPREFPVVPHAGYAAMCAVGWFGKWGCAGTVHMGVREWGVVGGYVRSVSGMV